MDPVTLAIMLTLAATGGMSAYMQADAQNKQLDAQAKIARNNATISRHEAVQAKQASQDKALKHRNQVAQLIGKQRASMGASGLVVEAGSFESVIDDSIALGKMDELAILHEGDLSAWRYRVQAQNYESQANIYKAGKTNKYLAALMGGVQGGVQGASIGYNLGGGTQQPTTQV